ncbi:hypothetical protein BDV12DRAFT_143145 [Aspergillus spectabilis]
MSHSGPGEGPSNYLHGHTQNQGQDHNHHHHTHTHTHTHNHTHTHTFTNEVLIASPTPSLRDELALQQTLNDDPQHTRTQPDKAQEEHEHEEEDSYDDNYYIYSTVSPNESSPFQSTDDSCSHGSQVEFQEGVEGKGGKEDEYGTEEWEEYSPTPTATPTPSPKEGEQSHQSREGAVSERDSGHGHGHEHKQEAQPQPQPNQPQDNSNGNDNDNDSTYTLFSSSPSTPPPTPPSDTKFTLNNTRKKYKKKCTFPYPAPCTINKGGEDPKLRKVITHIFGRNKACTKKIPKPIWVYWCRKHYQRARYRCWFADKSSNGVGENGYGECGGVTGRAWAIAQCGLVRKVLAEMEKWGGIEGFEVELRRREVARLENEGGDFGAGPGVGTGEATWTRPRGDSSSGGNREKGKERAQGRTEEGDEDKEDQKGKGKGKGKGKPKPKSKAKQPAGVKQKRPAVPAPVPDWLTQWVMARRRQTISFSDVRDLVTMVESHIAAVESVPGELLEVRFPDIEILANFNAFGAAYEVESSDYGSDGDGEDDGEAESEPELDDLGDDAGFHDGFDAGPARPSDPSSDSNTIPNSPPSSCGSAKRAHPSAFSDFRSSKRSKHSEP